MARRSHEACIASGDAATGHPPQAGVRSPRRSTSRDVMEALLAAIVAHRTHRTYPPSLSCCRAQLSAVCYPPRMSRNAARVLSDALQLPEQERLEIASELLESVEGCTDPEWRTSWEAELAERAERVRSGQEPVAEWDEVRARIAARLALR